MRYWVFTVGRKDLPPPQNWLADWPHHVAESWFARTKRPVSVSGGDRAVVYGSQRRGFLAAVEIVSDHPEENTHTDNEDAPRYPCVLRHRLLVSKQADGNAALPDSARELRRIARGPHTEISRAEYERFVTALLRAAARTAAGSPAGAA